MSKGDDCESSSAIIESLNELLAVFEDTESSIYEKMARWMKEDGGNVSGNLPSSLSECHMLHFIGLGELSDDDHKNVNGKILTELMRMTKSGVSKLAVKLQKKGLIQAGQAPENRREINYGLTEEGWKIFRLHAKLHDRVRSNLIRSIQEYDENDLSVIKDFLKKVIGITKTFFEEERF
jgi:DNA-binding MarR family transcriptional regulator